jgi:hypothetical protein
MFISFTALCSWIYRTDMLRYNLNTSHKQHLDFNVDMQPIPLPAASSTRTALPVNRAAIFKRCAAGVWGSAERKGGTFGE